MTPQDIFGIIIRSTAVFMTLWGAWYMLAGIKYLLPTIKMLYFDKKIDLNGAGYWIYAIPAMVCGIIIYMHPEPLINLTYPEKKHSEISNKNNV